MTQGEVIETEGQHKHKGSISTKDLYIDFLSCVEISITLNRVYFF